MMDLITPDFITIHVGPLFTCGLRDQISREAIWASLTGFDFVTNQVHIAYISCKECIETLALSSCMEAS